jgi:hypothetical protein
MTTPVAFFLVADDRPPADTWPDRILTMFSLLHQHAMREPDSNHANTYAELVEKAFSNLPGLSASKQRIATSHCTSLSAGIHTLLASARGAKPNEQLAFLEAHDLLSSDTDTNTNTNTTGSQDEDRFNPEEERTSSSDDSSNARTVTNCSTEAKPAARMHSPDMPPLSWTFFLGVVPRAAPGSIAERTLWIASVRWEPSVLLPKPDSKSDALGHPADDQSPAPDGETSLTVERKKDSKAGVLHARILEATLHPTFFDRYAERWSRFVTNAPAERIRNDAHFLFIQAN